MAGNLVKWWKHKILGGYKQFSVQECTTDSEELMYHQVRASSSCSAPPDLLLVSDRENNIPLRSPVVNIISTSSSATHTGGGTGGVTQKQQHQASQQNGTKDPTSKHLKISSNSKNSSKLVNTQMAALNHHHHHNSQQQQPQQQQPEESLGITGDGISGGQQPAHPHQRHSHQPHGVKAEERIRLEEFTCDVSVEGGKSSQPLQFSFTFYDLDGHHGKITKDDIVGIVYTIYESIGKSVVVPHCGSKTINVRLTVSPEGKSKAAMAAGKLKKMPGGSAAMAMLEHHTATAGKMHGGVATTSGGGHGGHARHRQHRYRPRKLIKSDDEDDDSNSEKEKEAAMAAAALALGSGKSKSYASKYNKIKLEAQQLCCRQQLQQEHNPEQTMEMSMSANNCQHDSLYENVTANLKCCGKDATTVTATAAAASVLKKCDMHQGSVSEECRGCGVSANAASGAVITNGSGGHHGRSTTATTTDVYMKQASSRVKMLRKARKQKYQDHCLETRQRSLSVGNETCWANRQQQQQQMAKNSPQPLQQQPPPHEQLGDVVDGVQLRHPHKNSDMMSAQKRNSAECWKTALNRNDLISIIRESMEKNRLCFQLNGKPQANVSPIRQPQHHQQPQHQSQQRQRSNTVSKIPTLIANHNNSITSHSHISNNNNNSISNNNSNSSQHHHHQHNNNNNNIDISLHHDNISLYHPQPHIPIYHQQMAINPAVLAAQSGIIGHSKMNLCGYDSFLHATICGGGTNHSPPPTTPPTLTSPTTMTISNQPTTQHQQHHQHQQPIATVQPIMTAVPNHLSISPKIFANSTTNQIKTSKILRSGSYTQTHHSSAHNSPQYHGYQRLSTSAAAHHHQQQQLLQQATKHNLAALNLQHPSLEKTQVEHLEKWLYARPKCQRTKKDAKNYDNLLYAKLSEKLQESSLNAENCNKENMQRRSSSKPHRLHKRPQNLTAAGTAITSSSSNDSNLAAKVEGDKQRSAYLPLIPIHGDPLECEHLLGQTTDEEISTNELGTPVDSQQRNDEAATMTSAGAEAHGKMLSETAVEVHVATDTLIDLNDDDNEVDKLIADKPLRIDDDDDVDDEEEEKSGADSNTAAALANTSITSASSLIHRYVHEHIHHHYHHFEDKEE